MRNYRNCMFGCLLLYLLISIIYLVRTMSQLVPGDPVRDLTCFLMIQNGAAAMLLLAGCLLWGRKERSNLYASPFQSLLVISKEGKLEEEVTLLDIRSLYLAKDKGGIVFKTASAAASDTFHYAVLNLVSGQWYIEAVSGTCPVGLKKENEGVVYRLKTAIPYKLSNHDMIYIDSKKIIIQ